MDPILYKTSGFENCLTSTMHQKFDSLKSSTSAIPFEFSQHPNFVISLLTDLISSIKVRINALKLRRNQSFLLPRNVDNWNFLNSATYCDSSPSQNRISR